eukprot:3831315-Rhodomonas_salina.1
MPDTNSSTAERARSAPPPEPTMSKPLHFGPHSVPRMRLVFGFSAVCVCARFAVGFRALAFARCWHGRVVCTCAELTAHACASRAVLLRLLLRRPPHLLLAEEKGRNPCSRGPARSLRSRAWSRAWSSSNCGDDFKSLEVVEMKLGAFAELENTWRHPTVPRSPTVLPSLPS